MDIFSLHQQNCWAKWYLQVQLFEELPDFSRVVTAFYIPSNNVPEFQFSHIFPTLIIIIFASNHPNWYEDIAHVISISISLITNHVDHVFAHHSYIFLTAMSVQAFAHLKYFFIFI